MWSAITMSFAGIELDSILLEARLPLEKVEKCKSLLSQFLTRKKVTLQEVQSLTGLLNFACLVIQPGQAFLRRHVDLTLGVKKANHKIRLNREVKEDLKIWLSFFSNFNGKFNFHGGQMASFSQIEPVHICYWFWRYIWTTLVLW